MVHPREQYLCSALDKFKAMIAHGGCSKTDIAYFSNLAKYELDRRGTSVDKKEWLTKKEACKELNISPSTFDRKVLREALPRGRKILHQHSLVWRHDDVGQLKKLMLLKRNT